MGTSLPVTSRISFPTISANVLCVVSQASRTALANTPASGATTCVMAYPAQAVAWATVPLMTLRAGLLAMTCASTVPTIAAAMTTRISTARPPPAAWEGG